MKFILPLCFITFFCNAQELVRSEKEQVVGYFGVLNSFQFLNQIEIALQDYSEKRNWLSTVPQISSSVNGFVIGGGFFDKKKTYYDLNFSYTSHKTLASGLSNYGYSSREFWVRNIGLGFDYLITSKNLFDQIYLGGSVLYYHLSFYSFSEFNDRWRIKGSYLSLSPKLQYIPIFLKRRVSVGFQFNLPVNPINISDLKKEMGTTNTNNYMWPCSFEISLKASIISLLL